VSRRSSVSIVSGCRLTTGVRSVAEAKNFSSSLCFQTRSVVPSFLSNGYHVVPFPGGKERPGREADYSPATSADIKNECTFSRCRVSSIYNYLYDYSLERGLSTTTTTWSSSRYRICISNMLMATYFVVATTHTQSVHI
jgi:hypothetical protein